MANNRMILVHVPSGICEHIGRRMGWGWYIRNQESMGRDLMKFYSDVEDWMDEHGGGASQDDFALLMEDAHDAPNIKDIKWSYDKADHKLIPVIEGDTK